MWRQSCSWGWRSDAVPLLIYVHGPSAYAYIIALRPLKEQFFIMSSSQESQFCSSERQHFMGSMTHSQLGNRAIVSWWAILPPHFGCIFWKGRKNWKTREFLRERWFGIFQFETNGPIAPFLMPRCVNATTVPGTGSILVPKSRQPVNSPALHQERDAFRITHFWKCFDPFFATTRLFMVIYHF
jgi:hypothetical protein